MRQSMLRHYRHQHRHHQHYCNLHAAMNEEKTLPASTGKGVGGVEGARRSNHSATNRYLRGVLQNYIVQAAEKRTYMLPSNNDCTRPSFHRSGLLVMLRT